MSYRYLPALLLAGLFWIGAAPHAHAACDNAKSDFDDVYCASKVYIHADDDLNTVYGKTAKLLDKDGKAKLKKSEVAWIKARNQACNRRDDTGNYINLDCATDWTRQRIDVLNSVADSCKAGTCKLDGLE